MSSLPAGTDLTSTDQALTNEFSGYTPSGFPYASFLLKIGGLAYSGDNYAHPGSVQQITDRLDLMLVPSAS